MDQKSQGKGGTDDEGIDDIYTYIHTNAIRKHFYLFIFFSVYYINNYYYSVISDENGFVHSRGVYRSYIFFYTNGIYSSSSENRQMLSEPNVL